MLANITCWVIALGLILSKTSSESEMYTKLLFAMGFIFLGILSKAVDYYREIRSGAVSKKKNEKKEDVVNNDIFAR